MNEIDRKPIWTAASPLVTDMTVKAPVISDDVRAMYDDLLGVSPKVLRGGTFPHALYRHWDYPTAFTSWGDEEHRAIARVVASGRFTSGNEVSAFEAELAAYHGVRHAICVNSGSSANLIAVAALFHVETRPLKRGDRVLVPGFAWATTWAPVIQMGLQIVLLDPSSDWNVRLEPGPWPRPLFVVTSMLGNPAQPVDTTMRNAPAKMIEDRCEAIGSGRVWADMTTLSFFYSHQLSAIEGGAVITDDDELARLCRLLRNHGWTREPGKATDDLNDEYRFELAGYNLRMTEMHAAVGREQLKKLDKAADARRANWRIWEAAAKQHGIETPPIAPGANPFGLTMLLPSRPTRARIARALRSNGIDCRPCAGGSFRKQPFGAPWADQQTPMADVIHERGLMIGCAPFDIRDRIDAAARIIGENL